MLIKELEQRCGNCDIIEYCGPICGYAICMDRRLNNVKVSTHKELAEIAIDSPKIKILEACEGCTREYCQAYEDENAENDGFVNDCDYADLCSDYFATQIADLVLAELAK